MSMLRRLPWLQPSQGDRFVRWGRFQTVSNRFARWMASWIRQRIFVPVTKPDRQGTCCTGSFNSFERLLISLNLSRRLPHEGNQGFATALKACEAGIDDLHFVVMERL